MSHRTKRQSLLSTLNEVFGPTPEIPVNLSPKDALQFLQATDDHEDKPTRHLPKCQETGKVCYPSRKVASEVSRRVQKKRSVTLRIYFCDHCKHQHLTSKNHD